MLELPVALGVVVRTVAFEAEVVEAVVVDRVVETEPGCTTKYVTVCFIVNGKRNVRTTCCC